MSCQDIGPVSLPELAEVELLNLCNPFLSFFSALLDSLFDAELHALEFIEETDVSEATVTSACYHISCTLVHWIILATIEADSCRGISMTGSFLKQSWLSGAFLEEPHTQRVVLLTGSDEDGLISQEVDMRH